MLRNEIGKYFELKESFIGPPTKYLGGKLREVELENEKKMLGFWFEKNMLRPQFRM